MNPDKDEQFQQEQTQAEMYAAAHKKSLVSSYILTTVLGPVGIMYVNIRGALMTIFGWVAIAIGMSHLMEMHSGYSMGMGASRYRRSVGYCQRSNNE